MKMKTILQTIGNTPLVELKEYSPNKNVTILAKLEGNNPSGSVKDRVALYMMKNALKNNILNKNKTIIEPTSGNTGIGLAMISSILGYSFVAVMPSTASIERRKILLAYGANIISTNGEKGTNYAIEVTKKIIANNPNKYVFLDQYSNDANPLAHYETTGIEIINEAPVLTHFVAGIGTGGTIMGIGKRLKAYNSKIQIIGVEPKPNSKIQGLRNMSAYTPPIFDQNKLDETLVIEQDEVAFELARDLYKREGISVGISSGAALWGAIQIAKRIKKGTIVTLFPDRGDKYTSTSLFNHFQKDH
jgi:cysteine synthase